jgi:hypothetical protein
MSSAKARRRKIEKAKARKFGEKTEFVKLQNPVSQHFPAFILGNALRWECMAHDSLIAHNREAAESLEPYGGLVAMHAANFGDPEATTKWRTFRGMVKDHCPDQFTVTEGSGAGQTLVIAGAGPSLADHAAEYCGRVDQVWGCNSAAPWLYKQGHKLTHGFTVDQTPAMINEWEDAPPVEYLLATTVHPFLTEHLMAKGHRIRWFHNFVGIQGGDLEWPDEDGNPIKMMREDWLYAVLFPSTVRAGSGLNAVTRAIDVAMYMQFDKVYVLGADCALRVTAPCPAGATMGSADHMKWLRESVIMHADGGNALASGATPMTMTGEVDGREWTTKCDMMISAVWLTKMKRRLGDRVEYIGDTLPNALANQPDEFLDRLPTLIGADGKPIMVP